MKRNLLVAFPGTGYTCGTGLLAAGLARAKAAGYETLPLDYGIDFGPVPTFAEAFNLAEAAVRPQLAAVSWARYDDILFLSKSLGTVTAARTLRALAPHSVPIRSLYLTPLADTLALVQPGDTVLGMVSGETDRLIDWRAVQTFCAGHGFPFLLCPGVGHGLAAEGDDAGNAAITANVLTMLGL